jgi:DNA modification methylase
MNALEKLTQATRMLAEVRDAKDAKKLMDLAAAAKHYATKACLGKKSIDYAHAIMIDAEVLFAQYWQPAPKATGGQPYQKKSTGTGREPVGTPTLASLGMTKKRAARGAVLRRVAAELPEVFAAVRDNIKEMSFAKRALDSRIRAVSLEILKASPPPAVPDISIVQGNAFDILAGLEPASIDCILTDPPYNVTEYDWDAHPNPGEYLDFIRRLLLACRRVLKPEYHFFMFCDAEYMARIEGLILNTGLEIKSRIIWIRKNISMGRVATDRFCSQWEPIFHCGSKPLNFPAEWGDERGDVQTYAVPQTNFKDKKIHPTQKPLELIERLMLLSTDPGGLVVDPFCGGGTTAIACHRLKRRCITCDTNSDYVVLAMARLNGQL